MNSLQKLTSISGPSESAATPELSADMRRLTGSLREQVLNMLSRRNGFYAFENALHVFSSATDASDSCLGMWNSNEL
jgi:hypothetical protein